MTAGNREELWELPGGAGAVEDLYAADTWSADKLGVHAAADHRTVSFVAISQPWLRRGAKCWALHRLALNHAFDTVIGGQASRISHVPPCPRDVLRQSGSRPSAQTSGLYRRTPRRQWPVATEQLRR